MITEQEIKQIFNNIDSNWEGMIKGELFEDGIDEWFYEEFYDDIMEKTSTMINRLTQNKTQDNENS